jgi:3-methyladenine DNA glycosylase AlkD
MTVKEIMAELKSLGDENIRKIFLKHGMKEPLFGVKIQHLKVIQKKIKKDYQLAKDLYATGNADAMYLAGLIADDEKMTRADLQSWVKQAASNSLCEYTVPWVTVGSKYGYELAMEWINAGEESVAAAGWSTLGGLVAVTPDDKLDSKSLKNLLTRVVKTIHTADNRVRYTMNGFIIALGAYVKTMTDDALAAAKKIGEVTVEMNGTACKVPDATAYILKIKEKGAIGKKKKTVKC